MKQSSTLILWLVGLVMAAIAAWQFYLFVVFRDSQGLLDVQGGKINLWLAIGSLTVACVCLFFGVLRHINKTEEFHITS